MRTAIDTNILIVLLRGQPALQAQHVAEVIAAHDRLGQLCISPLVWSELMVLLDKDKINTFTADRGIPQRYFTDLKVLNPLL